MYIQCICLCCLAIIPIAIQKSTFYIENYLTWMSLIQSESESKGHSWISETIMYVYVRHEL